jgi:riboflavin transporter FmnP
VKVILVIFKYIFGAFYVWWIYMIMRYVLPGLPPLFYRMLFIKNNSSATGDGYMLLMVLPFVFLISVFFSWIFYLGFIKHKR